MLDMLKYSGEFDSSVEFDEGGRTKFSKAQIVGLRNGFAANPYPDKDEYRHLAVSLGLSNKILHSWFQNNRHREKIPGRLSEETTMEMEDEDSKAPYNPGHKKTKFSEHQRFYLQSFFMEKEYVDENDISELSAELVLSPKVLRIWFQHARERKKKNLPILPSSRGRGRGKGSIRGGFTHFMQSRGRPPKYPREQVDDMDYDFGEDDSMSSEATKQSDAPEASWAQPGSTPLTSKENAFTPFQKAFLDDFYANIKSPDGDDLDYLCEHINVSRTRISDWFEEQRKFSSESNSVNVCVAIIDQILSNISKDVGLTFVGPADSTENFSCPYCGKSFPELSLLREHEKLEAIEFEREVQKLKTNGANSSNESYVVLEDSTEDSMMDVYDDEDYEDSCYEDDYSSLDDRFSMQDNADEHVKRPLNPFMIWLQEERKKLDGIRREGRTTGELVKDLSVVWKSLSEFDKMPYIEESRRLKELHKKEHPNYTFNPNRKRTYSSYVSGPTKIPKRANLVKSYTCIRCQVGFTTKGNLFKHLRNFHPENPYDPNFYQLGNEKGEEKNLRRCDKCNMDFISKIGLARHMLKAHNEQRQRRPAHPVSYDDDYSDSLDSLKREYQLSRSGLDYPEPVTSSSDRFYPSYEEEYERRSHVKTRFTSYQRQVLLDNFHRSITMSKCDAKQLYFQLADSLELPIKIIRIWFQNARSARRRGKPLFS